MSRFYCDHPRALIPTPPCVFRSTKNSWTDFPSQNAKNSTLDPKNLFLGWVVLYHILRKVLDTCKDHLSKICSCLEQQNLVLNSFSCPHQDATLTGSQLLSAHLQFRHQTCRKPVKSKIRYIRHNSKIRYI